MGRMVEKRILIDKVAVVIEGGELLCFSVWLERWFLGMYLKSKKRKS